MKKTFVLLWTLALPAAVSAQTVARPEVLIVGTFHMGNPGRDVHNMQADDVLSPKRQQEMAELAAVLRRFRPTRIAIEAAVGSRAVAQRYTDYLAGKYTLTRNETDQIAFRLARELGHTAVYPVDVDGDFPFLRVRNYAVANGRQEQFAAVQAQVAARVKAQDDFLRTHTLLEMLRYMNAESVAAQGMADDYALIQFGEPYEYAGADLIAAWFQRNIRIHHNIRALITSPEERILVIYGAGHLGWLRENFRHDGTVRVRTLSEFAGEPAAR
ncbi:MAG TPA: DUF5694 domain-containing protein [Longimicrobium sp.]|jgi:hypothetical protein